LRHALTRRLPYRPEQLFELVGAVELYPEFVPWVSDMRVSGRRAGGEGVTLLDAKAQVGFAIIHESFSTRVRLDRPGLAINADLLSGPFRRLETRWRFAEADGGADLSFVIDFEFRSRLLHTLLAANFERAVARLIGCFERRAQALYG
jgi:coenzyme Q-binding protein COQ10